MARTVGNATSYAALVAKWDRQAKAAEPGHGDTYEDVLSSGLATLSVLKRGVYAPRSTERPSMVRINAESFAHDKHNDPLGPGVDILDWEPAFPGGRPPVSTGVSRKGLLQRTATLRSSSGPNSAASSPRRSRPGLAGAAGELANALSARHRSMKSRAPAAGGSGGGAADAPQRARPTRIQLPPESGRPEGGYGSGADSAPQTARSTAAGSRAGTEGGEASSEEDEQSAAINDDARSMRSTRSMRSMRSRAASRRMGSRAASRASSFRSCALSEEEDLDDWVGAGGATLSAALLAGDPSKSITATRADVAILELTRTAYEPGEQRQSLMVPQPPGAGAGPGAEGRSGRFSRVSGAGPGAWGQGVPAQGADGALAPVPRALPAHLAQSLHAPTSVVLAAAQQGVVLAHEPTPHEALAASLRECPSPVQRTPTALRQHRHSDNAALLRHSVGAPLQLHSPPPHGAGSGGPSPGGPASLAAPPAPDDPNAPRWPTTRSRYPSVNVNTHNLGRAPAAHRDLPSPSTPPGPSPSGGSFTAGWGGKRASVLGAGLGLGPGDAGRVAGSLDGTTRGHSMGQLPWGVGGNRGALRASAPQDTCGAEGGHGSGHGSPLALPSPTAAGAGVGAAAQHLHHHGAPGGGVWPASLSAAVPSPARAGMRPGARTSTTGAPSPGAPGAEGSAAWGAAGGGAGSPGAGGLVRGYAGGGPLDYRMLDVIPRLGLEGGPRLKGVAAPQAGTAAAGPGCGGDAHPGGSPAHRHSCTNGLHEGGGAGSADALRRSLAATPAGLRAGSRPSTSALDDPGAALRRSGGALGPGGGGSGGVVPPDGLPRQPSSGRFARVRRSSEAVEGGPSPSGPSGSAGHGGVLAGAMMVTREQVDRYQQQQQAVMAEAAVARGQAGRVRAGAIGVRGSVTGEGGLLPGLGLGAPGGAGAGGAATAQQ